MLSMYEPFLWRSCEEDFGREDPLVPRCPHAPTSEERLMSDPCLSGLWPAGFEWADSVSRSDPSGLEPGEIWSPDQTDFYDDDDETPVVTLRLEMEHPSGDEDLTIYAEVQIDPDKADWGVDPPGVSAVISLRDMLADALRECSGYRTWLNDPDRALAIWEANEKPGGTA